MLTQEEFDLLSRFAGDKKITKKQLINHIRDNLVIRQSSVRDLSSYTVPTNSKIKSVGADKGASIMTEKDSKKNDRQVI